MAARRRTPPAWEMSFPRGEQSSVDLYVRLGVGPSAQPGEIVHALRRTLHALFSKRDRLVVTRDLAENEAEEMRSALHAYLVLTDPELRSAYDARRSMAKINADLARRLARTARLLDVLFDVWTI